MRARLCCFFLVLFLQLLSLVGGSSRNFVPPNDGLALNNQGKVQNPKSLQITHIPDELKGMKKKMGLMGKSEKYKEMKKIGSSPPSCEHKCYGCMPCEAIQVPTTSSRVGVQYTYYEPEGWKCKCGPTFYSP
ncbi:hypothetical protein CDL12_05005 [Handroanthus impetiginosus]|uniref:Epidermal patterning factor-like protein n=1 Tax=Handroanthus impetiginosus TaxID=429701 RepID=A0A2G9HXP6_9LAMI|nr:hypothetical protein CDL12_05005 [Handroanthus impetiginosus]